MDVLKSDVFKLDKKNKVDGLKLLSEINDEMVSVAFFDPQYRGVLDKLKYGNEGKGRGKARSSLVQMNKDTIIEFIKEINRVLKKSGHLFLWVDKFHLCEGVDKWFVGTALNQVDMLVWSKIHMGMGCRTRHTSEFLMVFQKSPVKAKGYWFNHSIPDVWVEKVIKNHPHSKPVELQRKLIEATTVDGDIVLDPAAGGYSVLEACNQLGRSFIGGDIEYGEE